MNCCICKKKLKENAPLVNGEPQWFGSWRFDVLIKAICSDCMKDPINKEIYRKNK